ncbi:arylsulfotransferase family protein [Catenulispora sp. NF23]|uniref:arylsulfotransferase family protein n=1 Tax=Catenulispora pinistramenti TaxID=2705254 RepID=UPI001BAB4A77|nr:arylsulfotransferase family protein [Catenulispora pinistramenti]MBS2534354.1 arylsulfotransferase family protein [Catenulispora pinistramenti]
MPKTPRSKVQIAAFVAAATMAGAIPAATAHASDPASAAAAVAAAAAAAPHLPAWTVLTDAHGAGNGKIFVAPSSSDGTYANGVEILSPDGKKTVWSHEVPAGLSAADFRAQTYHGKPVLTWWQGTGLGGLASGVDVVYDADYRQIAEVHAGNGYTADGHEFAITSHNTALILAYKEKTADLTVLGGSSHQKVIDGVVQEIDIATGKVLFQWDAADHVPYSQSEQPLPASPDTPWDWFHINAVKQDGENLLVDARNTWTAYELSHSTGKILWQLGGKASTFKLQAAPGQELNDAGAFFSWQHDPEPLGGGRYSFFDNESAGVANTGAGAVSDYPYSRVVTVRLDPAKHIATLVKAEAQPAGLIASSQGNAQPERGGRTFVGWGALPYVSEFDRGGAVVFSAEFPAGVNTYRAYRFDWK